MSDQETIPEKIPTENVYTKKNPNNEMDPPVLFRTLNEEKWIYALSNLIKKNESTYCFYEYNLFDKSYLLDFSSNFINSEHMEHIIQNPSYKMEEKPLFQYKYHVLKEGNNYYKLLQYWDLINNILIQEEKIIFDEYVLHETYERIKYRKQIENANRKCK